MGYIFTVVTMGLLWAVETMGLLRAAETLGLLWAISSMGLIRAVIDWPNMGQTDRILAINGLELESSVHGPTITGHR